MRALLEPRYVQQVRVIDHIGTGSTKRLGKLSVQ